VIGQAIQSQGIDLLIMGAYTHSPLRTLFMGSKTSELLRAARVPTLLLR
jgi:nucleotide-binding universal stress UspA family protein